MNEKISEEEEKQEYLISYIGHFYYEQITSGIMKPDGLMRDIIEQIEDSYRSIEQYRKEIEELNTVRICPIVILDIVLRVFYVVDVG